MNFLLSDEQVELKRQLEKRLESVCGARAVHDHIDGKADRAPAVWAELVAFGVPGMGIAAEFGGLGLEMIDLALVADCLGYAAAPGPFLGHTLAALAIQASGSDEQKRRWLPLLASGERLATIALAEGNADWLPAQWTASGEGALSGRKRAVPHALEAQLAVVGLAGGRLGIVELAQPAVSRVRRKSVDRTRTSDDLVFDRANVELLASDAEAAERLVDAGLVLIAADAFGGASRCLDMANGYVKLREQFGVKLAEFQGIRHQLANMLTEIEPCRGLYWYAAHAFDHVRDRSRHVSSVAKQHITDRFLQAARECVELHGGIGYTWEYDAHIWFKRAMHDWAYLGNAHAHRSRAADHYDW